jgi:hypothetical protein
MSRLKALHIHLIGVFVAAGVAAGLYFTLIPPASENVKTQKAAYDAVHTEAMTRSREEQGYKKAVADKLDAEARYRVYEAQYMPKFGFKSTRLATMRYVFWPNHGKSWPERFIKTVQTHMDRQTKANGIVWLNPGVITYPAYGPDPNGIPKYIGGDLAQPIFRYSFPVEVQAPNMTRLLRHLQAWYRIRNAGVPVVEGLQIAGNSPNLQAKYNVSLTIIMHDTLPAANPRIGGSDAAAGATAMPAALPTPGAGGRPTGGGGGGGGNRASRRRAD